MGNNIARSLGIGFVLRALLLAACFAESDQDRPNFVFIITDDISVDDLEPYGNEGVSTPNLSRLAEQALVFDNAYLTISSCSPSRNSIVTGRYPHNTGAPELHTPLPAEQATFVQAMKEAGYFTVLSGKNHMAPPEQLGFGQYSNSQPAGSENWVDHLRDRPKDRPFFFWFASHDAHRPWNVNELAPKYDGDELPVPPMLYDGPLTRGDLVGYYHEVSRSDYYLGQVLNELDRQGIADNTYVIWCSDNGRPFPRCKTYLYESGIQTPLLVAGPGVESGRTDSIVSSIDFSSTIMALAGLEQPDTVQGVSFAPIFSDPNATTREVAFAERNWHVYQVHERMVRTGDWLYIWNAWPNIPNLSGESSVFRFDAVRELWAMKEAGKLDANQERLTKVPQPVEQLYRVDRDAYQFDNLATDPQFSRALDELRSLLERWQRETGDSIPLNPTPNRQPYHENRELDVIRGDFPGESHRATEINAPGPIFR